MSVADPDEYAGWEAYPQSLCFSSIEVDDRRSNHRISQLTDQLFVEKDESRFEYLELDAPRTGTYLDLCASDRC